MTEFPVTVYHHIFFVDHDDGRRDRFLWYLSFVCKIRVPSVIDQFPSQWTSNTGSLISYSRVMDVSTRRKSQQQANNDCKYDDSVKMNCISKMITVGVRGARLAAMWMVCIATESIKLNWYCRRTGVTNLKCNRSGDVVLEKKTQFLKSRQQLGFLLFFEKKNTGHF